MIAPVQTAAAFPDPSGSEAAQLQATAPPPAKTDAPAAETRTDADVRLTIDSAPGGFVYTLRDRASGRILAQLPRHEAARLGESSDYTAGDLVKTKA